MLLLIGLALFTARLFLFSIAFACGYNVKMKWISLIVQFVMVFANPGTYNYSHMRLCDPEKANCLARPVDVCKWLILTVTAIYRENAVIGG